MGARTPEELEALFEDALLLEDGGGLAALFAAGALLAVNDEPPMGGEGLWRAVLARLGNGHPYVADCRQTLVARDIALMVGERGVNVARRDRDGGWRYAIVRLTEDDYDGRYGTEAES